MRILIFFLISLLSTSSAMAFPTNAQKTELKQSLIKKVQLQRACRRGYNLCSFDAYDRRGLCRQSVYRMPPHIRRRILRRCNRQFRAAINRCKRRFCRFYPFERQIRPRFDREDFRPRRELFD